MIIFQSDFRHFDRNNTARSEKRRQLLFKGKTNLERKVRIWGEKVKIHNAFQLIIHGINHKLNGVVYLFVSLFTCWLVKRNTKREKCRAPTVDILIKL